VNTPDRVLTRADLVSTLTVEAAVHHLDLVLRLGRPLPGGWDDVTAARCGTGREPLSASDRSELGDAAGAFPLFG
jgi:hypothetical protein